MTRRLSRAQSPNPSAFPSSCSISILTRTSALPPTPMVAASVWGPRVSAAAPVLGAAGRVATVVFGRSPLNTRANDGPGAPWPLSPAFPPLPPWPPALPASEDCRSPPMLPSMPGVPIVPFRHRHPRGTRGVTRQARSLSLPTTKRPTLAPPPVPAVPAMPRIHLHHHHHPLPRTIVRSPGPPRAEWVRPNVGPHHPGATAATTTLAWHPTSLRSCRCRRRSLDQ